MITEQQPLNVNFANPVDMLKVLQVGPLLHSCTADWENIDLQVYGATPSWETPVHTSEQHILIVHLEQELAIERQIGEKQQPDPAQIGDIDIIPAHAEHRCAWLDEGASVLVITLDSAFVSRIAREFADLDCIELLPTFAKSDPFIYGTGLALKEALETDGKGSKLYAESLSQALGTHLLHKYANRSPKIRDDEDGLSHHRLKQAIAYIHDRLEQDISLDAIACYLGISQYHFCRWFKQSMGVPPYQYVIQQRIERAKILLRNKELNLVDVALECGFNSQSHLIRHFKKQTSITPRQYRQL